MNRPYWLPPLRNTRLHHIAAQYNRGKLSPQSMRADIDKNTSRLFQQVRLLGGKAARRADDTGSPALHGRRVEGAAQGNSTGIGDETSLWRKCAESRCNLTKRHGPRQFREPWIERLFDSRYHLAPQAVGMFVPIVPPPLLTISANNGNDPRRPHCRQVGYRPLKGVAVRKPDIHMDIRRRPGRLRRCRDSRLARYGGFRSHGAFVYISPAVGSP